MNRHYSQLRFRAILSAVFSLALSAIAFPQNAAPLAPSTVAFARHSGAIEDFRDDPVIVRRMVDSVVAGAAGKSGSSAAWKTFVSPSDHVGIKIATAGGRFFSTHHSVVAAIIDGLVDAGVSRKNILIWDRNRADMNAAGYHSTEDGCLVWAIDPPAGYDRNISLSAPVMGKLIWGDLLFSGKPTPVKGSIRTTDEENLSSESHLAQVLSQVTKVINVPVMSDSACGLAGCIYNMTISNIDNWRRFLQPPEFGDPYICELYADEHIGRKVVLNIMDGLIAQFAGGPEFQPNYAFRFKTIYASKDPVAIDATALREIEKWRSQANLPPIEERAGYLKSAAAAGLGNFDPDRIILDQVLPEK